MSKFTEQLKAAGVDGDALYAWNLCYRAAEQIEDLLEALQTSLSIMKIQRDIVEKGQHSSAWEHPISMCEKAITKATS